MTYLFSKWWAFAICIKITNDSEPGLHFEISSPVVNRETKFAFTIKALVILLVLHWQTKVQYNDVFLQVLLFRYGSKS